MPELAPPTPPPVRRPLPPSGISHFPLTSISMSWLCSLRSSVPDFTQTLEIPADRVDSRMWMETDKTLAFSRLPRRACALQGEGESVRMGSFPWEARIDGFLA
jgi:hypothetical protein